MNRYRYGFFAARLRELVEQIRDDHGLGQSQLAELAGQSPSTMSDWCNQRSVPESRDVLRRVAATLARTLDRSESGVFAELCHAMQLDVLDHTLRTRLEISLDTASDLLDELRLSA